MTYKKKTAVLIDLTFAIKKIQHTIHRFPNASDICLLSRMCIRSQEELFRTFCYHSPPFAETANHPLSGKAIDFSRTRAFRNNSRLIKDLKTSNGVAYRNGSLQFCGWIIKPHALRDVTSNARQLKDEDLQPDFRQKEVDMKIGLDVASLSSRGIVDRIALVTADSDFIAPMKFARREGVQIVLVTLGLSHVKHDLMEHADEFRNIDLSSL